VKKIQLVIVSPALADANNGNWQTARRWQKMLSVHHATRITQHWPDAHSADDDIMIALHARRSAPAIAAWAAQRGNAGLAVVLTGTDLYRDIALDASAQQSLALAHKLVVLQALGAQALPDSVRAKATVIFQSTPSRLPARKTGQHLRAVMVGHLRDEKDPLTLMAAARALPPGRAILIDHIGAPLDPVLATAAQATAYDCPIYRWLGGLPHEATRRRIQRAHLLVHTSRMEGGAHVLMEAICSGTPVLASRIAGNVGMLGEDYGGYFEPGDAEALARLLMLARETQDQADGLLYRLSRQCMQRAPLFTPQTEQQHLLDMVASLRKN
jgi:putative glycosyltransferase (TIGR04348 family)